MLKTNSKQARANVIGYIRKYALDCLEERKEYSKKPVNLSNDAEMLGYIHEIFRAEKLSHGAVLPFRAGRIYRLGARAGVKSAFSVLLEPLRG